MTKKNTTSRDSSGVVFRFRCSAAYLELIALLVESVYSPGTSTACLNAVETPAETPGDGSAHIIPKRVSGDSTKEPSIAKPEASSTKPVKAEPSAAERRTGYLFGEHADGYDPENLEHRKIKDMTHEEFAQAANERSLTGRNNWTKEDFSRLVASHGKSSNPNASYVRGYLLQEDINTQNFLKRAKSGGLQKSSGPKEMTPNLESLCEESLRPETRN